MPLIVKLAENVAAAHEDKITLKAESTIQATDRNPIVIPLPGTIVTGYDVGRVTHRITITGVVDYEVKELFIDTVGGTPPFQIGETITGQVAWNATVTGGSAVGTTPYSRTNTATCVLRGASPDLTNPTSLYVDTWGSTPATSRDDMFFVNNETISGNTSGAMALINEAFPSKKRLEQFSEWMYYNGAMTLTTRDGSYSVQIKALNIQMESGKEDRFTFRMDLVQIE